MVFTLAKHEWANREINENSWVRSCWRQGAILVTGRAPQRFLAGTVMCVSSTAMVAGTAVTSHVVGKENHGLGVAGIGPVLRAPLTLWWPL